MIDYIRSDTPMYAVPFGREAQEPKDFGDYAFQALRAVLPNVAIGDFTNVQPMVGFDMRDRAPLLPASHLGHDCVYLAGASHLAVGVC